jgi:hypothetical protein
MRDGGLGGGGWRQAGEGSGDGGRGKVGLNEPAVLAHLHLGYTKVGRVSRWARASDKEHE